MNALLCVSGALRSRDEPPNSEKDDEDLRRDERVRQAARRSRHCEPSDQRPRRGARAVRQQQAARGGHHLLLLNRVAQMSERQAIGRYDHSAEQSHAKIEQPRIGVARHERDHGDKTCSRRARPRR